MQFDEILSRHRARPEDEVIGFRWQPGFSHGFWIITQHSLPLEDSSCIKYFVFARSQCHSPQSL